MPLLTLCIKNQQKFAVHDSSLLLLGRSFSSLTNPSTEHADPPVGTTRAQFIPRMDRFPTERVLPLRGPEAGGGKGPLPRKPLFSSCQVYEFQAARKILKDAENLIIWFTLKCEPQYILNSVRLSSFLSLAKFLWEFIQTDLFGSFPPTQAEAACTSTSTRRFYYKYIKSAFWIASVSTFPTAGSCSGTLLAAGLAFLEGTERGRISKSSDTELM